MGRQRKQGLGGDGGDGGDGSNGSRGDGWECTFAIRACPVALPCDDGSLLQLVFRPQPLRVLDDVAVLDKHHPVAQLLLRHQAVTVLVYLLKDDPAQTDRRSLRQWHCPRGQTDASHECVEQTRGQLG